MDYHVPCRRVCSDDETLAQVLVGCMPMNNFWNARHNDVLDIVAAEIRMHSGAVLHVNETCRYYPSTDRVDLQVYFEDKNTLFLVNVKCPYDTMRNLEIADIRNVDKYFYLLEEITESCGFTVILDTFIVGALGAWMPNNETLLNELNLGHRIKLIANACGESNLRWSQRQWAAFEDPRVRQNLHTFDDEIHDPTATMETLQEGSIFDDSDSESIFRTDHGLW